MNKTLRLKVRREAWPWLDQAAREVNLVWNWANETSDRAIRRYAGAPRFLSGYDLGALTAGASACMERIQADTINRVCIEYAVRRRKAKRSRLKWRASSGAKRALGWIPFKGINIAVKDRGIRFCGKFFRLHEFALLRGNVRLRGGQFAQNAIGEWFLTVAVSSDVGELEPVSRVVGIDLGLKSIATTSDGDVLDAPSFFRAIQPQLADAQRRGHKRQAKLLHAKAANRRADALHKFSRKIVDTYQDIYVGDVSSSKLAKTRMAKSVLDAGWGMLKTQLLYKGQWAGRCVEIVDERNTTRACSSCGQHTGPSGLRQLVVRQWECSACGAKHDRDINAARNILIAASRHGRPSAGTRATSSGVAPRVSDHEQDGQESP